MSLGNIKQDCFGIRYLLQTLSEGGGVCGTIFAKAGSRELTVACKTIGYFETESAVITPGFHLKAKYIIHAVDPRWMRIRC